MEICVLTASENCIVLALQMVEKFWATFCPSLYLLDFSQARTGSVWIHPNSLILCPSPADILPFFLFSHVSNTSYRTSTLFFFALWLAFCSLCTDAFFFASFSFWSTSGRHFLSLFYHVFFFFFFFLQSTTSRTKRFFLQVVGSMTNWPDFTLSFFKQLVDLNYCNVLQILHLNSIDIQI